VFVYPGDADQENQINEKRYARVAVVAHLPVLGVSQPRMRVL